MIKNPICKYQRLRFNPWIGKIPWSRKWQPTPVFLPEYSHGQRSLADYSSWGLKESDMTEHAHVQHARHDKCNNIGSYQFLFSFSDEQLKSSVVR